MTDSENPPRPSASAAAGIFARGFAMGAADLIPGVSGGTVAFISGIYARLLAAISVFSGAEIWRELLRGAIAPAWRRADGFFLAPLLAGILSAIVLLGGLLHYLLRHHAHLLLGFFFGMVVASAAAVALRLLRPRFLHLTLAFAGGAIAFAVVTVPPLGGGEPGMLFVFSGGAVAISAMLLPGISGSYLLLILGLYEKILSALHERDILLLLVFAAGCGAGLLAFARILTRILRRWHDGVISFLIGVMLGALPKLWPWKTAGEEKTILRANVLPGDFSGDAQILFTAILALAGAGIVFLLHSISRR